MSHQIAAVPAKAPLVSHAWKMVAAVASTGAALVSIASFLTTWGPFGDAESRQTIGSVGVAWVGVRPAADTATSIGDTLHLAATITDKRGALMVGARPTWTSDDPAIATVLPDGSVVARGAGVTTVTLAVGDHAARARIFVRQQVASVEVKGGDGREVVVPEVGRRLLRAVGYDARGNAVVRTDAPQWRAADAAIATVDSAGVVSGEGVGRTIVEATMGGVTGRAAVVVVATADAVLGVSGTAQRGPAGRELAQPVVVRVASRRGRAVEGALVTFRAADGQGSASPASALTDAEGRARTTWTLGPMPGRQTMTAVVPQVDSALVMTAEADPVAANARLTTAADSLAARAGERLAAPVVVRLADSTGRALADVPVTWRLLDGGTLDAADARTDSLGEARARWTLGARAGAQRLRVQAGALRGPHALAPLTIAARATAGPPATVLLAGGDAQRGTVGAPLARALVVRVLDAAGNGVAGLPLALRASAGALADSAVTTDSTGAARVRWTLGREAGEQRLTIRTPGVGKPLEARARAVPGRAANVVVEEARAKRGAVGRPVVVRVTDEYGNAVPDTRVKLATRDGRVTPERAVTDASGEVRATWTPRGAGERTLSASVVGGEAKGRLVTNGRE